MTYFLSLFAGIGGFDLAAYWAGLRFDGHYFSEIDKYAAAVFQKRFPEAVALGDVRSIGYDKLPEGEWIITGGFPCQDISVAGKKAGLEGERSGLFSEYIRLIGELRPAFAIMENVGNLASWFDAGEGRYPPPEALVEGGEWTVEVDQYQGIAKCVGSLSEIGYDAEWAVIRASDVGAPHRRDRIWIVGYPRGGGCGGVARRRAGAEPPHGHLQLETRALADPQGKQREGSGNSRSRRVGFTDGSEDMADHHVLDDDTSGHGTGQICGERSPEAEVSRSDPDADGQRCQELIDRITTRARDADSPSCRNGIGNFRAVEPGVGRSLNGVSARLDGIGGLSNEAKTRARKILSGVWGKDGEKALQWTIGRFDGISEEEVLLVVMCEYEAERNRIGHEVACKTVKGINLRNLWRYIESSRSPHRRQYYEQYSGEYSDALYSLSPETSLLFPQAWKDDTWENGIDRVVHKSKNRVNRLKGLGNSVVPQIPELIFMSPAFDRWRFVKEEGSEK